MKKVYERVVVRNEYNKLAEDMVLSAIEDVKKPFTTKSKSRHALEVIEQNAVISRKFLQSQWVDLCLCGTTLTQKVILEGLDKEYPGWRHK